MNKEISIRLRLGSMLLDHALICFIIVPPIIILKNLGYHIGSDSNQPSTISSYFFSPIFAIYFCKDIVGGRSLAKRILKLQVISEGKKISASPFQSFLRNIPILIWPIEVVVSIINPQRRLGDKLAETRLVIFDPSIDKQVRTISQMFVTILSAFILSILATFILDQI